ncbi:hypothetical protein MPER_00199, partial [Moniliophthora perniciosa FA553]
SLLAMTKYFNTLLDPNGESKKESCGNLKKDETYYTFTYIIS